MRNRQGGMTLISTLCIAALVALIGYAVLRLIPVYLTEMKVKNIMSGLESEFVGQEVTAAEIMNTITKRLDIDMVTVPDRRDFRIMKTDSGLRVEVSYEREVPYIANLSIIARFSDVAEIDR